MTFRIQRACNTDRWCGLLICCATLQEPGRPSVLTSMKRASPARNNNIPHLISDNQFTAIINAEDTPGPNEALF